MEEATKKIWYLHCEKCRYDSGDQDSVSDLVVKIVRDGGHADRIGTSGFYFFGCPSGCDPKHMFLD